MSILLTNELNNGQKVSQPFRIDRPVHLRAIKVWLFINGVINNGQLIARIKLNNNVIATTTITNTEFNSANVNPYKHGYFRLNFDGTFLSLQEGDFTEYVLEIENDGIETNKLMVCRQWDRTHSYITYGEPLVDTNSPYGFEIFEYRGI